MSLSYYFNILGGGFVVLGGLMIVEVMLKSPRHYAYGSIPYLLNLVLRL
ncbi:Protein of unknown function [Bacillus mycoides]|nr:Protein of unknown function [Bacillus mycoides]